MSLYFNPSRPDKNTDRARWNKSWEYDLVLNYGSAIPRSYPVAALSPEAIKFVKSTLPQTRLYHATETREVCELQTDLSRFATQQLAVDNFEQKWRALPQTRREEFVLEALWRTSCAGPDMEERRKWCPEMTTKNLAGNGGKGYIELLLKFTTDDLETQITEPIFIPHSRVDILFQNDPLRIMADNLRLHRSYFMSMVLWRILLAFYDRKEEYLLAKSPRQSSQDSSKFLREAAKILGTGNDGARRMRDEFKERMEDHVNVCWNCKLDATRLKQGNELKACAGCRKIGRLIRYCSRECQVNDWKNGIPMPHKRICGKRLIDESKVPPAEQEPNEAIAERIPAPDRSFKRTPALLYQISILKRPPYVDYVFVYPPPQDDDGVTLIVGRKEFLVMRRRALKCGDKTAVCAMFYLLAPYAESFHVPLSQVKNQLWNEYRVDVDSVLLDDIPPPTEEELDIVTKMLEETPRG